MSYDDLVVDKEIPEVSYLTKARPETVHPRILYKNAVPHVFCMKKQIPLEAFLRRYAKGERGLHLGAYRKSNGRQTTITFSESNLSTGQLKLGPKFLSAIDAIRTLMADIPSATPIDSRDDDDGALTKSSSDRRRRTTLDELEKILARQREIGKLGEDAALRHEFVRLHDLGCKNPAAHIKSLSEDDVGAGYDLESSFNGVTRYIEVKSSVSKGDPFTLYLSENERETLAGYGDSAFIYLVFVDCTDSRNSRVIKEIPNPMNDPAVKLDAVAYKSLITIG